MIKKYICKKKIMKSKYLFFYFVISLSFSNVFVNPIQRVVGRLTRTKNGLIKMLNYRLYDNANYYAFFEFLIISLICL